MGLAQRLNEQDREVRDRIAHRVVSSAPAGISMTNDTVTAPWGL